MGVALTSLIEPKEVSIEGLSGKVVAIDAMNMLYQFVTTIRQQDGTPLKDSKGNVTSHLTGLFARCSKLLEKGVKLVFVFDGVMPELKKEERKRREQRKAEAFASLREAESTKDVENMKKFASRTSRVSKEMISEAKELLTGLGIPIIDAPSEGEAQAAFMVRNGDCDFVGSQDMDCLIYGAPRFVRNLSLSQRRKKINALTYKTILPEIIELSEVLEQLELSLEQLQAMAMLIGTDFNIGGVKGLGPKKSLQLVKEFKDDFKGLFEHVEFEKHCGVKWEEVFKTIHSIPVTDDYKVEFSSIDEDKVKEVLVDNHDFSQERVTDKLASIQAAKKKSQQTALGKFF